jgi:hypothetical protein
MTSTIQYMPEPFQSAPLPNNAQSSVEDPNRKEFEGFGRIWKKFGYGFGARYC